MATTDSEKTEKVTVRCSLEQRERWEGLSAGEERTLADWIRVTIDRIARGEAILVPCTAEQRKEWEEAAIADRRTVADWTSVQLDDSAKRQMTETSSARKR